MPNSHNSSHKSSWIEVNTDTKAKQAYSLRAHVKQLQTPWDYNEGKKSKLLQMG